MQEADWVKSPLGNYWRSFASAIRCVPPFLELDQIDYINKIKLLIRDVVDQLANEGTFPECAVFCSLGLYTCIVDAVW